ncbi:MAG: glycosyltransferase family 4 protein [Elainella sp.]
MKITFVLPFAGLSGGVRVAAIYAEKLQQMGHDVFAVSLPPDPVPWKRQLKSVLSGKGWIKNVGQPSHFDGRAVNHHVLTERRAIAAKDVPDADVVVATWWETAEWVNRFPASKGTKVYFIQHHETLIDPDSSDRVMATYYMPMHKITISKWLLELMGERYGDNQVSLVLNSVDTDQFNAPRRGRQTKPTVGLLYSSIFWKGCDVSFKALEIVRQQFPDLQLVTFGNELFAEQLPSYGRYSFRPAQDIIRTLYASCDVWVCGSRSEGFCLPLLEAMACRCPVVSTATGGASDIIRDGVNGYLVQVEDSEALAKRIIQVLQLSEPDWQRMSDAAYNQALSYSWDDAAQLFEKALEQAIQRDQRSVSELTSR